jgi:hypothetical protein
MKTEAVVVVRSVIGIIPEAGSGKLRIALGTGVV